MCGIAGIVMRDGLRPVDPEDLRAMAKAMVHRGPDDEGMLVDGAVGLIMRRLSVIDVAGGHQPIWSEDRTVAVVQNGEIYNFTGLREELSQAGHRFHTSSDTEAIVHLYEQTGPGEALPRRLAGMFAIAVYDAARQTILLARDRAGKKPLFLYRDRDLLAFASELTAIFASFLPMDRSFDPAAVRAYLEVQHVPGPGTMYSRVRQLPPGSMLVLERSADGWKEREERRYWSLHDPSRDDEPAPRSFSEAAGRCETLIADAVRVRLQSDVPLGAFLSGGVDSSLIAAFMAEQRPGLVRTLSIGFEDPALDESAAAAEVARHLGTKHRSLTMPAPRADDFLAIVDRCDQPLADPAVVPTWYLCRMAREELTVALSGEGADEVFGGYRWYRVRGRLSPEELCLRREQEPAEVRRSLTPSPPASAGDDRVRAAYAAAGAECAGEAPMARLQWVDFRTWMADDLLVKVDRASMAHSLEVRCPYLDHRLIELALPGPDGWKVRWGRRKALLRAVALRKLPRRVVMRKKHGFQVPVDSLMRTTLSGLLADLTSPASVREHGLLDPQGVAAALRRWREDPSLARLVWKILCLQAWLHRHARHAAPAGRSS